MQKIRRSRGTLALPWFRAQCCILGAILSLVSVGSHVASAQANNEPTYMEEGQGKTHLWLGGGPTHWLSDRGTHPQSIPAGAILGVSHIIDPVRLSWRLRWAHDSAESTNFVSVDLFSVERVYLQGPIRPYLRGGLAVGLDLTHPSQSFGGSGFFNEGFGNTGGPGITLGAGLDIQLNRHFVLQGDVGTSVYGGVGLTAVSTQAILALGYGM